MDSKSISSTSASRISRQPALPTSKLLPPSEVASLLSVNINTLSVWRCTKRYPSLKYVKVGRSVRYRQEDVQAFLAERTI